MFEYVNNYLFHKRDPILNMNTNLDINLDPDPDQKSNILSQYWIDSLNICNKQFESARSTVYNATLGYFYTSGIMRHVLVEIPDNSKILDVGIGTGCAYSHNSDLIKRKNIHIIGIDIDPGYTRKAKHTMIDDDLESHVKIILGDIYEIDCQQDILVNSFDFVFFSDSYAVIPGVHIMMTYCEKFLKPTGMMVVTSTLFDNYNETIEWIKQRLIYVSSIEFGNMMLKGILEEYIGSRYSGDVNECFRNIETSIIPGTECKINTYIVKWIPDKRFNT